MICIADIVYIPFLAGHPCVCESPEKIVDEMEHLSKEYQSSCSTSPIRSSTGLPIISRRYAVSFSKRKLNVSWTGFFREDEVSHENLSLARDVGLCGVYFSGDALTTRGLSCLTKG